MGVDYVSLDVGAPGGNMPAKTLHMVVGCTYDVDLKLVS